VRRLTTRYLLAATILAAALGACGDKKQPPPDEGDVSGEVLKGTISDEMLPLEQLKSHPPLAAPVAAPSAASSDAPDDGEATDEAAAPPAPSPAQYEE
jgi:hypothetical protein